MVDHPASMLEIWVQSPALQIERGKSKGERGEWVTENGEEKGGGRLGGAEKSGEKTQCHPVFFLPQLRTCLKGLNVSAGLVISDFYRFTSMCVHQYLNKIST